MKYPTQLELDVVKGISDAFYSGRSVESFFSNATSVTRTSSSAGSLFDLEYANFDRFKLLRRFSASVTLQRSDTLEADEREYGVIVLISDTKVVHVELFSLGHDVPVEFAGYTILAIREVGSAAPMANLGYYPVDKPNVTR